ncbi:MAG: 60 kDa inner rane insertion protein preprotein translocase subunit YidC [Parcubacteria group bacterium]|nr:60 kDa inner rane insertion protein preprotein translocase subunit YidC [Parcubacteria group bacterium]
MSSLYHAVIFNPLYNLLIALFTVLPWADAGVVVIILTIIVRLILYPLSKKAVMTQVRMQEINPRIKEINQKYKDDAEEKAKATLALYKETGVNPFSGVLVLIIQLPIIWALYRIFLQSGFPNVNTELLYGFIHVPSHINTLFLGLIDITQKSALLALLAAITTFLQLKLATKSSAPSAKGSFGEDLAESMQKQMKYLFPILVFFISYKISGVIALYWLTSNVFTIGQELVVRRKIEKLKTA